MSPVTLAELDPQTRAKVFQQIGETEGTTALATVAPTEREIISRSPQAREQRGQRLANQFVKFIGEMVPLLVQVRQDFMEKPADETICGVTTFEAYCTEVLRYSRRRIQQLIQGSNPASDKHDGSANRQPKPPVQPETPASVEPVNNWQPDATDDCMPVYTKDPALLNMCAVCIEHPHKITERPFDYSMHPELQTQTASRSHGMGLERLRNLAAELNVACAIKYDDGFKITCTYSFASEVEAKRWLQTQPK